MDPQHEQSPHTSSSHQHQKVQHVAQQLLKAMNDPLSGSGDTNNIIIFLTKLYKNNSPSKNKKMKSIRLNRFVGLLEYFVGVEFPKTKEDVEILYHCVASTLMNDKNFYDQEDSDFLYSMGVQIAKTIEKLCEGQYGFWAVKLLSYLILNETLTLSMQLPQFQQHLKQSTYYQTINLDNSIQQQSHRGSSNSPTQHQTHILNHLPISTIILNNISLQKVYSQLFKSHENKVQIVNLFYSHLQRLTLVPLTVTRKQVFIECFIEGRETLSVGEVEALLKILEKDGFDKETINDVVNIITHEKLTLEKLIEVDFKKIKGIEEVFVQCLLQQTSTKSIDEIIQIFLNMKSDKNYFPLYLILKLNKKIPLDYVNLFFQDNSQQVFTIRKAIIFTLAIVDNEREAFDSLIENFVKWTKVERIRTKKNFQCILKAVHFSLQSTSKANIISMILRHIHKQNLNDESFLQFLPYNTPKTNEQTKQLLTQSSRQGLNTLFKTLTEFDKMIKPTPTLMTPQQTKEQQLEHKCRLDLEFMLNSNPFVQKEIMTCFKELNKMLDGSVTVEELIKMLPNLKDNLLEVTLMYVNNKYDTFYCEEVNTQTLEWALKAYKKFGSELNLQLKSLLEKEKLDRYYKLIKTLIEFGMEKGEQLKINSNSNISSQTSNNSKIFTPQIKGIINACNNKNQRLSTNNNINDYFMRQSKWKTFVNFQEKSIEKPYKKIVWLKCLLVEIKDLVKNLIKAEKAGGKKQVKNLVADHIDDVLAFKAIHEYFECGIENEGRQVLIEVFKHIAPEIDFFERTEAQASALGIQFYSILQELPHLLEQFTSPTLIFLSQLISHQKALTHQQPEQKKSKKTKKKNNNQPNPQNQDNPVITTITKNFSLLFTDPNASESYRSLFVILRKLTDLDKIDKVELQKELNAWLLEINFITCTGFEPWKNKGLALAKMWKNAADLMSDKKIQRKFQTEVLEKHFNLFTDLLNKLYETFRSQPQFLQMQQRILLSLCLIYKKQDFSNQIEPETDMIDFLLKRFQQKNISRIVLDNKFYYCHECKKSACYACSSFLHRNHDKIYTGKIGTCEHETAKDGSLSKRDFLLKSEGGVSSIFGGVTAILKKNEDLPEQLLDRISQKLMLDEQLRANEDGEFGGGRMHSPHIQQLLQGRIPKNKQQRTEQIKKKLRQKQMQYRNEMSRLEKKGISSNEDDEKTITPQAEQQFQYKEPYCKQFKKIHSQLNPIIPKISIPSSKINVSPLAKVFLRQLQHQHFHYDDQEQTVNLITNQSGSSISQKQKSLTVQEIKDKYLFFRNNNLKGENRDYYGRGRGGYGGFTYGTTNQKNDVIPKRSIIACNKKYLFVPSSLSIMNLSMAKLKEKLQKKIQNKEFTVQQQEKNYVSTPPANLPFDIVQTSLSQSPTTPILAAIGTNQVCFYSVNADGRFGRQINPEFHRMDNILKFTWINDRKNLFAIAYNHYVRICGISPSNNVKTFAKAQIGKSIRDFDGYMNSKLYMLFIVDSSGKMYFVQVDFKEGKNAAYSSADRAITFLDQQSKPLQSEIYSVKNVDGNKLLLSLQNGSLRIAEISRETNQWKTTAFDLKKIMKSDLPIVLETIKIVKTDDEAIYISGIARKFKAFENRSTRKCQGSLILIKIHENPALSSVLFTKEENIESYDFTYSSSGTLLFIYANDEGIINIFKHVIQVQPTQIVQKITPAMDNNSIKAFCKKLVANNVFFRVQDGAMLKNLQFKENKIITGNFTINTKEKEQVTIKELYPTCTHFVSGISIEVQLPSSITQYTGEDSSKEQQCVAVIKVKFMESTYSFYCNSKKREIQIPLNLKQTIEIFAHENDIKLSYTVEINEQIIEKEKFTQKEMEEFVKIKSINLFGFQARDLSNTTLQQSSTSLYHTAFKQLFYDWLIYQQYPKDGFEEYLLNFYRMDFHNVDMKRLYKLKYDNANHGHGFKMDEINLFLKLELFSQTVGQSLMSEKAATKEDVEAYLDCIKKELLDKDYKRKSLQNSVYRLCQVVCQVYESKTPVSVGHPYHKESLVNLHHFVICYKKWLQKKTILTFDQLCTLLSNLILTQALDLQLILQVCPQLIIELSINFRKLIHERKHKQYTEEEAEISLTKICSKYIAILCEYYQVMKNNTNERTEQKLLFLLEQVFGQAKSDMPKQLVMNPLLYLESIMNLNEFTEIQSSLELFGIDQQSGSNDFSGSYFDLDRQQKLAKKPKKQSSSSPNNEMKEEQQLLLNQNSNYEAIIEEEKQMEEEEKEMYMEIQEEFDDDEDDEEEMGLDEVEAMEMEMLDRKEDNRVFINSKDIVNGEKENIVSQVPEETHQLSSSQKNLNEIITRTLLSQAFPNLKKITVHHHDFPLELAIALFRKQNYLTPNNIYFYLGLLYNLLKIIENNLKIRQNKAKVMEFVSEVDRKAEDKEYSSLFIVLGFFVCPKYGKGANQSTVMKKPESILSEHFANYYLKNQSRFVHLLTTYNPTTFSPVCKLSEIMRFNPFQMKNELYNLRLIANIYLSFRLYGNNFSKEEERSSIKEELLFKFVKYRLPVLKNIMLYEKWETELDRAKLLVSYEILKDETKKFEEKQAGINMLYKCAKDTPNKFIEELMGDEQKVIFLEEFSLNQGKQANQNIQKKIFQLLEVYYNS